MHIHNSSSQSPTVPGTPELFRAVADAYTEQLKGRRVCVACDFRFPLMSGWLPCGQACGKEEHQGGGCGEQSGSSQGSQEA